MSKTIPGFATIALFAATVVVCRTVAAQVIYEPVRYQYGGQTPYYYGGDNPAAFAYAGALTHENGWGRTGGYAFHSGDINSFREVVSEPERVLSDQLPYSNAAVLGYTATDARNTAYDNVPRYFVKRDLLAAGVIVPDETGHAMLIIPAQARPAPARYVPRPSRDVAAPTTRPSILIIPSLKKAPAVVTAQAVVVAKGS